MDHQAYALLEAFHQEADGGSLHDGDVYRLNAFIHYVARQPLTIQQIERQTVTFLSTHPNRPWRPVVAQDLGTRVCQGVELLRCAPLPT